MRSWELIELMDCGFTNLSPFTLDLHPVFDIIILLVIFPPTACGLRCRRLRDRRRRSYGLLLGLWFLGGFRRLWLFCWLSLYLCQF